MFFNLPRFVGLLLVCAVQSQAQIATEAWVQRYGYTGVAEDTAYATVVDSAGNVILAGVSRGDGWTDLVLMKLSSAGVPMWTNRYGRADEPFVAVDHSNNVFVAVTSRDTKGYPDYVTLAYSTSGVALWTNRYDGPYFFSEDRPHGIAVDSVGNVFVTGSSRIDEVAGFNIDLDYLTIAYSSAGIPLWTNRYSGQEPSWPSVDVAKAIAVDPSGDIIITGYSDDSIGFADFTTIKYSNAGIALWTNRYNGPDNNRDEANAIAVDGTGNVFVTGLATSANQSHYDCATVAYSSAGVPLWTNLYAQTGNRNAIGVAIAVAGNGNVIIAGDAAATSGFPYNDGFFTIAYSSVGTAFWTNRYNGPENVGYYADPVVEDVAVGNDGNIYVTGGFVGAGGNQDYATIAYSNTGAALWTNRYNGPGDGFDRAFAIALDGGGNLIVTGGSYDAATSSDFTTIKYSSAGLGLWTNRHNEAATYRAMAHALAVTPNNRVIVTGYSKRNYSDFDDPEDYTTIAYSDAGVPLWTNHYNGPGNGTDRANAIAVDVSGNVFVTGFSAASVIGYADYATVKYSNDGIGLWTNRYDGPGNRGDAAAAITVDGTGNVFVTGYSTATNGYADCTTIKYSNTGVALWTNRYSRPGGLSVEARAIVVDGSGNVFVVGNDYATIKYSNAGVALWTNRYVGPGNGDDAAAAIAVDGTGNVFVTGVSDSTNGYLDYATIKYSNSGVALWTNRYSGPERTYDGATAVAVDVSGNVFVTGVSVSTNGYGDYATIKYSNAGVALWTNRYDGPGNGTDAAAAIAVDGTGNVFVTGGSGSTNGYFDYVTIKYSSAGVPLRTNRYNGPDNREDRPLTKQSIALGVGGVYVTGSSFDPYRFATVKYSEPWPPQVVTHPVSSTNWLGSNAVFSVVAAGFPPPTYQWQHNGIPIVEATNAGLTLSNVSFANQGGYSAVITNDYGSATSSVALLSLIWPTTASADFITVAVNGALTNVASQLLLNDFVGTANGMNSNIAIIAVSAVSANGGNAQLVDTAITAWTQRYAGPGNGTDFGNAIVVDDGGSVIVTGVSSYDYITIKYSGDGLPVWTNRYAGDENRLDSAGSMAVDVSGNVFVTGTSEVFGGGQGKYVTIKYSAVGAAVWTNRYGAIGAGAAASSLALDTNGNLVVTGADGDFATIKYSSSGTALWTNRYNGPGNSSDQAKVVAVDHVNNVIVAGSSYGSGNSLDYATIKYSNSGTALWTNRYNGPGDFHDEIRGIAVDSSNNVVVTGNSYGSSSGRDYATIKYSSGGVPLWTNRYIGPGNSALGQDSDAPNAVAVDGSNNVYVTGSSMGPNAYTDYVTIKYSGAGVPLWTNRYGEIGNTSDVANAIAIGGSNTVYVTGNSGFSGFEDYVTIRYSSSGAMMWLNRHNGPENRADSANAMAVDETGNIYVTGSSISTSSGGDLVTIKLINAKDINYTPPLNFLGIDTFTYVVRDSLGLTSTGTVSVAVGVSSQVVISQPPAISNGVFTVVFSGIPNAPYAIEVLGDLTGTWQNLTNVVASPTGQIPFSTPTTGSTMRFYRVNPL